MALECDIAEMYLRNKVAQEGEGRPYQQFLWRVVKPEEKPDLYEFVVFGIN